MWARNLLFCMLCVTGVAAMAHTLFRADSSPPRRATSVKPADATFLQTVEQVDGSFRRDWQESGLHPAGRATDLTIARRLSLALEGTIPSLEEIRQLEARSSEDRIAWWLEGLLADRRYADYFAERLARPLVGVENGPFLLYRRRRFVAWLADQLHENRRYDRIARDVIASQGLWTDHPATNFITVTAKADDGNKPDVNKLTMRVCRAFLGMRLDCAQCHDHPFNDSWQQRDFQHLAAFFAQAKTTLTGIRDSGGPYWVEDPEANTKEIVLPEVPFQEELLPKKGTYRARLATWLTHAENKAFAQATVNRVWALMLGRPLVTPLDDISPEGPRPEALDLLAADFAHSGYDLQRLIRMIAATEVFQLDSAARSDDPAEQLSPEHEQAWAAFPITRERPEQVVGSLLQSASLTTIDYESHIVVRIARALGQRNFVDRYGDAGEQELEAGGGTIPQRLLMLNGNLVHERTKDNMLFNASTRIATLAPDDETAIETAYLAVLTRRPTADEAEHFLARLTDSQDQQRTKRMADLYWTLINSTEFSWNH